MIFNIPKTIRVRRVDDGFFERLKNPASYRALEKFTGMKPDVWCWTVQPHGTEKIILLVFQSWKLAEAVEIYDASNT